VNPEQNIHSSSNCGEQRGKDWQIYKQCWSINPYAGAPFSSTIFRYSN